jgi:hypothetical protein
MTSKAAPERLFLRVKRQRGDGGDELQQELIRCSGLVSDKTLRFMRVTVGAASPSLAHPSTIAQPFMSPHYPSPPKKTSSSDHARDATEVARPASHSSAKRLPTADDVASRDMERRQLHAVELRRSLRCRKVQRLRGGIRLIDLAAGDGDDEACCCWDLYQRLSESGSDDDCPNEAADDESFGLSKLRIAPRERSRVDSKERRGDADVIFAIDSLPDESMWEFDDFEDVLEGEVPAGYDNYVQYDHRHDDEYDSNAEDHPDNDYPDDSDDERQMGADKEDDVEGFWEGYCSDSY